MKEKQSVIALQVLDNDRTWNVKHCERHISTGWRKFAFDNNLKVGDVCLFEMIKSNAYAFKVLIFRLGEEHSLPPQGNPSWFFFNLLLFFVDLKNNGYTFCPLNQLMEMELIGLKQQESLELKVKLSCHIKVNL